MNGSGISCTVVNAIGGNPQRKRSYGGNRRLASGAVRHHPWHRLDIGPPATGLFPPARDRNGFYRDLSSDAAEPDWRASNLHKTQLGVGRICSAPRHNQGNVVVLFI